MLADLATVAEDLARPAVPGETYRNVKALAAEHEVNGFILAAVREALAWGLQGRVIDVGHANFEFSIHRLVLSLIGPSRSAVPPLGKGRNGTPLRSGSEVATFRAPSVPLER